LAAYGRGAILAGVNDSTGTYDRKFDLGDILMDILIVSDGTYIIAAGTKVLVIKEQQIDPEDPTRVIWYERMYYDDFVCKLDPTDFQTIWMHQFPRSSDTYIYAHTPIISGDWIIVGDDSGNVFAFNGRNRADNWGNSLGQGVRLSMAASKNYIYLNEGCSPKGDQNIPAKFKFIDINTGNSL
jgi:outer membrane protein assembly factor BamB